MKAGFGMNVICVFVICVMMITYGNLIFDIYAIPGSEMNNATMTTSVPLFNSTLQ